MVYSLNGIRFLKNRRIGDLYSKINKLQVFLPKLLGKKKANFKNVTCIMRPFLAKHTKVYIACGCLFVYVYHKCTKSYVIITPSHFNIMMTLETKEKIMIKL